MDRCIARGRGNREGIPHTRGDGPPVAAKPVAEAGYSPHAWGWTEDGEAVTQPVYVFPTRVGMDR